MFKFNSEYGMRRIRMQHTERLAWFVLDIEKQEAIPEVKALEKKLVIGVEGVYYTKSEFILVAVSQDGFKIPKFLVRFIIKLKEGDPKTRISTFTKGPLYFEAEGLIVRPEKYGLEFANATTNGTPPLEILRTLVTVKETPTLNHQRSIHILNKGD